MRRLRNQLRIGGLAAVGTATLILPLLTMTPADAVIPKANLSITKLVASTNPTIAFDPVLRDVRLNGDDWWTPEGLHIKTTDDDGESKVGEYVASDTPLSDVGEPNVEYDVISGAIPPGFVLKVDFTGDGISDGELIGEPDYYGNTWWLNEPRYNPGGATGFAYAELYAPVCGAAPCNTTGNGHDGTLAQWRASFPTATVTGWGFGLGSGVLGEGIVTALNFAGTHYDLSRHYEPALKAEPGETVEYELTVSNAGGALTAQNVQVTDVLPSELTYVPDSLDDNGNGCAFTPNGRVLTCNAGSFPIGVSTTITFQATLDDAISSVGLPTTPGHEVDVEKFSEVAEMPAGEGSTFAVACPAGSMATDGGLLLDVIHPPGGFFSDVVINASKRVPGNPDKWRVDVTNLGDAHVQGQVMVTCLDKTLGSSEGHHHEILASSTAATVAAMNGGAASGPSGTEVTTTCPDGTLPIAPSHEFDAGVGVVRESYADGQDWVWVVDHGAGTSGWFGATCLSTETTEDSSGPHATLELAVPFDTITIAPESTSEGMMTCADGGHAITGGFAGYGAALLSLGKQPRGTSDYMFRFTNEDWEDAYDADIQVTCVDVQTEPEPAYYHVVNTASVSTTTNNKTSANTVSSADIAIDGDPLAPPPAGVQVGPTATRSFNATLTKTKTVNLSVSCAAACSFTVKVIKGGDVMANATKSLAAGSVDVSVKVPTTPAGKNLGTVLVDVRVKTTSGTSTYPVDIIA